MNTPDDHQQHCALSSITKAFLAFWKKRVTKPETLIKRHEATLQGTSAMLSFSGGPLDGITGHPSDLHNAGDILSNGYYLPTDEDNVFQYSEAL